MTYSFVIFVGLFVHCNANIGWKVNGSMHYYISQEPLNRTSAAAFCESHGGHLATDIDDAKHQFLVTLRDSNGYRKDKLWLGLKRSSRYQWTAETSHPTPTDILGNSDDGPCIKRQNGSFKYSNCSAKNQFVCKRENMTTCDSEMANQPNTCYQLQAASNYGMATFYCNYIGAYLITSATNAESDIIENEIGVNTPYWVGLTSYFWDSQHPLYWQMWSPGSPKGNDCVALSFSTWQDVACDDQLKFICESEYNNLTTMAIKDELTTMATKDELTTHRHTTVHTELTTSVQTTTFHTTSSNQYTTSNSNDTLALSMVTNINSSDGFSTVSESYHSTPFVATTTLPMNTQSQMSVLMTPGSTVDPVLIGSVIGGAVMLTVIILTVVCVCKRARRQTRAEKKGDYDAAYEIAYTQNTEDRTRNSDSSLTDDEKLAQLRNRDSRVVIDANVPDSEKIKPYLVTTIVDGHSEGQPSRRSKVVSSIEDRVEYDNNNLDELIVTDNDLYHSSGSDPNRSDGRPRSTDYDYAVRPPHPNQQSQANVFINNAYDGEAEGGAGNHNQGAQIQYADIAFSMETLNKENTYADIEDFAPSLAATDAKFPATEGIDQRGNTPGISNNDADSGNQAGEMKAIPVYAEVDANKMDKNKNEIIDDRKDAHDAEEGVNDLIVTDNDLYDFNN